MAKNPVTQIIISAKDEASSVFSGLKAHAGKIAGAIAGYFSAKLFGDVVGAARDFETAMSAVQAASGATGAELQALRAAAEEAGASTKYSAVEAANALETLSKAGLSASESAQALPAVLDLASAGGVELGAAADYVTKAVNGMGLEFSEAGRVADVLAMGANASSTSVEGLAGALSYAAPLANTLGLSLEQTVAIIGKFADAGIDASRAGTALNSILAQFSDPASKFRKELAAAGITTGDFDQALRQLAAAGPAGQRAINAVGTEAGPALRALLNQGIGSLDELKAKLDQSAGSARTFAETMSNNLDGAAKGFGSAWDALLIKLGSPVLPVLRDQLNAVSDRLRAFVTDGTAEAFGSAIKAAFESAGRWVQEFISKVDFKQLAADMQAFAARAGELFDALGTKSDEVARNATIAFGVMSTSLNTILAAVYKVGEAFAGVGGNIVSVAGWIAEAFAKITFGGLSASFAAAADEIRIAAGGLWATSEAFAQQSSAAFDRATADALRVREAWDGVGTGAAAAAAQATTALEAVETQAGLTADQVAALGDGAVVMGGKVEQAGAQAASAAGNISATGTAARSAAQDVATLGVSAAQVAEAFQRLGVTSTAELKRIADNALADYNTIRNSGTATAADLQRAFTAYAEKSIVANNGVASATLQAEAAMRGLKIEVDASGKAVVRAMTEAATATDKAAESATRAAGSYTQMAVAAKEAADSVGRIGPNLAQGPQRQSYEGSAASPVLAILNRAEQLGGLELRKQFEEQYSNRARRQGMRVASFGMADYAEYWQNVNDQLDQMQIEQERTSGRYQSNAPRIVEQKSREEVVTHRVSVGIGAGRTTTVNTASREDADALVNLLKQLESDALRA
jgi:TP901 family phage tail tape measure protein